MFQNHWVINTEVKYWMAEKYHTKFCPHCHNTFLGQNQVRNHLMYSPGCSQSIPCHCCAPGDQLKCEHCVRHFIIRSYLELAGEIGYVPPNGRSLYHNSNWQAVKEDLTARERLYDQSPHFSNFSSLWSMEKLAATGLTFDPRRASVAKGFTTCELI